MKTHGLRWISVFIAAFFLVPAVFVKGFAVYSGEEEAVGKVAESIIAKIGTLRDKKCAVLHFSNLEGKQTPEGTRLSNKILSELHKNGDIILVERTELDKIMKEQGLEQTGIIESGSYSVTGRILPVDVMVTGTLVLFDGKGELSVKTVDVATGEIYAFSTVEYNTKEKSTYAENRERLELYKKAPQTVDLMTKTYQTLSFLQSRHPMLFLLAVIEDEDIPVIRKNNPGLGMRLKAIGKKLRDERPAGMRKLKALRAGIQALKEHDPEKYSELMKTKSDLFNEKVRRGGFR